MVDVAVQLDRRPMGYHSYMTARDEFLLEKQAPQTAISRIIMTKSLLRMDLSMLVVWVVVG